MLTKPHFEIKSHRNLSLKERWTGRDFYSMSIIIFLCMIKISILSIRMNKV
jgi:hypothetical protein